MSQEVLKPTSAISRPKQKRQRRTANEIDRIYKCKFEFCQKAYGSEGARRMHMKLKHNAVMIRTHSANIHSLYHNIHLMNVLHGTGMVTSMPTPLNPYLTPTNEALQEKVAWIGKHPSAARANRLVPIAPATTSLAFALSLFQAGYWKDDTDNSMQLVIDFTERRFVILFGSSSLEIHVPFYTVASYSLVPMEIGLMLSYSLLQPPQFMQNGQPCVDFTSPIGDFWEFHSMSFTSGLSGMLLCDALDRTGVSMREPDSLEMPLPSSFLPPASPLPPAPLPSNSLSELLHTL